MLNLILHIIRALRPDKITPVWKQFAQQRKAEIKVGADILITYPWKDYLFHIENRMDYISGTSRQFYFSIARTEIVSNSDFSLLIEREGFLPSVGKLFGKKEIKTGSADFDKAFYIRSSDEQMARSILQYSSIRDLLLRFHIVRLQIGREPGYFDEQPPQGSIMVYVALDYELKTQEGLTAFDLLLRELASATALFTEKAVPQ